MDKKLLDILVCPVSKGSLEYDEAQQELICKTSRLAYPIRDGIPVMLEDQARSLDQPSNSSLSGDSDVHAPNAVH
jgi:hypothetical protein